MKQQRMRESEKGKKEERISKRKSQQKEDAGSRKGRKVAKHGVFPMFCGSVGPKSRQNTSASQRFWQLRS